MSLVIRPSAIVGTKSGFDYFNSGAKPFARITSAELTIAVGDAGGPMPAGLVFDNTVGNTYAYGYVTGTNSFTHVPYDICDSIGRIPPQEWGPAALGYASPHVFDDIDLGAVPDGADFLELAINFTRTTTPSTAGTAAQIIIDWPIEITEGEQIELEGQSCVLEHEEGFSRQFWVEIVSGRAVLRRQQSVVNAGSLSGYPGLYTHYIDERSGGGSGSGTSVGIGTGNHCSFVNSVDYTSVYEGTLIITPCVYTSP